MHTILRTILAFLAKLILSLKKPTIIGVTGTVWKTTVTTHIVRLFEKAYGKKMVQYSPYHYNGEYGLPLTIIGARTWGKNPFRWIWVVCVALFQLIRPYPRFVVLEYGIDHPGEMEFLLRIAVPDIAVVTPIESNHLEQFWTLERYRREKLHILASARHKIAHSSLRMFLDDDVELFGSERHDTAHIIDAQTLLSGMSFRVKYMDHVDTFSLPAFGQYQGENILPLYSIARILHIDFSYISQVSQEAIPEEGRSRIFTPSDRLTIIDGTYNWWLLSIREGVRTLAPFFETHHVVLLLGDMRELGELAEPLHDTLAHDIQAIIPETANVSVFLVWPLMRDVVAPILQDRFFVETTLSSRSIWREIREHIKHLDHPVILFAKGSQNTIFLEEALKSLLPARDHIHLCRQSADWIRKKTLFFESISS